PMCCVCSLFFFSSRRRHTRSTRDWSSDVCSSDLAGVVHVARGHAPGRRAEAVARPIIGVGAGRAADGGRLEPVGLVVGEGVGAADRKSIRLNSSHEWISYAVFCLKKKKQIQKYKC